MLRSTPNIDLEANAAYALRNDARQGPEHSFCFHMLADVPCECVHSWGGVVEPRYPIFMDHATWWAKDKTPYSIVFQPYNLHQQALTVLDQRCQALGLRYKISGNEGWYNPGRTLMVEVTRSHG